MNFTDAIKNMLAIQERQLYRKKSKETSIEAAQSIFPRMTELHTEVLRYAFDCGYGGFTDVDMNRHFNTEMSTYRARRSELEKAGLIVDSGHRVIYPERGNKRRHTVFISKEFKIDKID